MSCVVESFYGQYVSSCLLPLSTNSICSGSNSYGAHIAKTDKVVDSLVPVIMSMLNLKPHIISQMCDDQQLECVLPYTVEIHKYLTSESDPIYLIHQS